VRALGKYSFIQMQSSTFSRTIFLYCVWGAIPWKDFFQIKNQISN
jgi:hypothetical protein